MYKVSVVRDEDVNVVAKRVENIINKVEMVKVNYLVETNHPFSNHIYTAIITYKEN